MGRAHRSGRLAAPPGAREPRRRAQVRNLSGGELQRVAITMALGQPANVYLIDEPSAYLDSEQRIVAAKARRPPAPPGRGARAKARADRAVVCSPGAHHLAPWTLWPVFENILCGAAGAKACCR
jgi:hypothetical protein